jgi:hypothetical protein
LICFCNFKLRDRLSSIIYPDYLFDLNRFFDAFFNFMFESKDFFLTADEKS